MHVSNIKMPILDKYPQVQEVAHMKSSAAVFKWNLDFSSLGSEESGSLPFENSILPRWRIAATTLNIAS